MSLLFNVLFAEKCKSTHHKLALDSLLHLKNEHAPRWRNLFLRNIEAYLEGAKAPDTRFKDFTNHVLHVRDNNWGGAPRAAAKWYDKTVELLANKDWNDAIYAAGVLSHYYTDPLMPFHTGQSEEETVIHRAAEWSMTKSYDTLRGMLIDELGYPDVAVPSGGDWLEQMVIEGACVSNPHYEALIERYDFEVGRKRPVEGLDEDLRIRIARCLGHATVGFSRILDRAFVDAGVAPPRKGITLIGVLSKLTVPIFWVTKRMHNSRQRKIVEMIYREYQQTGRVLTYLPEDEYAVREAHAREVLNVPLAELDEKPLRPIGTQYGKPVGKESGIAKPAARTEPAPTARKVEQPTPAVANVKQSPPQRTVNTAGRPPVTPRVAPAQPAKPQAVSTTSSPAQNLARTIASGTPAKTAQSTTATTQSKPANFARPEAKKINPADPFADFGSMRKIIDPQAETPRGGNTTAKQPPAEPPQKPTISLKDSLPPELRPNTESTADASGESDGPKFYLDRNCPVVDAPSIGPKTASRLEGVGIRTVADLLGANATGVAARLGVTYITAEVFRDWQRQARLCCQIPNLRGHDSQILVACGVTDPTDLVALDAEELFELVAPFCESEEGQRILRSGKSPTVEEVGDWIDWSQSARPLKAA
ncbi:hypothetical protein Pan189_01800 [Stratiformator vulcanicus]|uniref:Uncharacterized protein n=2 Tax=Stratiformator vulcanicus TaxID=2527980 RepID=A0A517QW64_9PLAN|nr:hypothetical protein Pan189_01800 [Stratiformator vulcanicus]